MTAGAVYRVLALFLRKAKVVFARGAFAVDVRFSVAEAIAYHLEKALKFSPNLQPRAIFLLTRVYIS
jgi:hypothetical protein